MLFRTCLLWIIFFYLQIKLGNHLLRLIEEDRFDSFKLNVTTFLLGSFDFLFSIGLLFGLSILCMVIAALVAIAIYMYIGILYCFANR